MPDDQKPVDQFDDGREIASGDLTPSNTKKIPKNATAVAITAGDDPAALPRIAAAGRGKLAEQILQLAFENGVPVREDSALADMLASVELDSPIPSEAFFAVAEVLSYVYRANGEPNPFDAVLNPIEQTPITPPDENS
jgi:flagellar biosynthesis protein